MPHSQSVLKGATPLRYKHGVGSPNGKTMSVWDMIALKDYQKFVMEEQMKAQANDL